MHEKKYINSDSHIVCIVVVVAVIIFDAFCITEKFRGMNISFTSYKHFSSNVYIFMMNEHIDCSYYCCCQHHICIYAYSVERRRRCLGMGTIHLIEVRKERNLWKCIAFSESHVRNRIKRIQWMTFMDILFRVLWLSLLLYTIDCSRSHSENIYVLYEVFFGVRVIEICHFLEVLLWSIHVIIRFLSKYSWNVLKSII